MSGVFIGNGDGEWKPVAGIGALRFTPAPYPTIAELREAGKIPTGFNATISAETTSEGLQVLQDIAAMLEAERREAACAAAIEAGVGLRVDVHDWHTEYWLDPSIPAGEIQERRCEP